MNTSTAVVAATPELVNAAVASSEGSKRIQLTTAERANLAHNLKVAMAASGLPMDRFRRSNGVEINWSTMKTALTGTGTGYFSKSLDILGVLAGLTAAQVLKPQSKRRPMTDVPAVNSEAVVATETAAGRTAINVEGYRRQQPTGPRSNPVIKPVDVSAHTKSKGVRSELPETANTEYAQVNEPPAAKVGSVLFQIGTEVMYLPLANLKSMVANADGTLTFTVKP